MDGRVMADAIGLPCFEAEVSCGTWCQGGTVTMTPADGLRYTGADSVWVRGDDAARLRAELVKAKENEEFALSNARTIDRERMAMEKYLTDKAAENGQMVIDLRAEVEALRQALEKIVALGEAMPDDAEEVQIAKSALAAAGRRERNE
jgi:hypothetical protein